MEQLDVNNAFLKEEVYMDQPLGFKATGSSKVCKLQKALYGLKQAPRAWFTRLHSILRQMGLQGSKCNPSLDIMYRADAVFYVLINVDDIIVTGSSTSLVNHLINHLDTTFALKKLGSLNYFLGIEVTKTKTGGLFLTQKKYIRDILAKAKMQGCKPYQTPMVSTSCLSKHQAVPFQDPTLYRCIVGALQYLTNTRPELSFPVNKVCQFMAHPLDTQWGDVKRILSYLQGTLNLI